MSLRAVCLVIAAAHLLLGCGDSDTCAESCGANGGDDGAQGAGPPDAVGGHGGDAGHGGGGGSPLAECTPSALATGQTLGDTCTGAFVDSHADALGDGSRSAPFRRLSDAIAGGAATVYVCGGIYAEESATVEVPAGLTIYGGLDCSWRYTGEQPAFFGVANAPVMSFTGPGERVLEDVDIQARSASGQSGKQGNSSLAIVVDGAPATLRRSRVQARTGATGAPGASPQPQEAPAPNGLAGDAGCTDSTPNFGGAEGENRCLDGTGTANETGGGRGGLGDNTAVGGAGGVGQPAGSGGAPGKGQDATPCTPGGVGTTGSNGLPGIAAEGPGAISVDGYSGPATPRAPRGDPGGGGGGGGGGRECTGGVNAGASGGGGAAGGCGGDGGDAGGPGGASIAVVVVGDGAVLLDRVQLVTADGGDGGDGAAGQLGQPGGGSGGIGGFAGTDNDLTTAACYGGPGGDGGGGGPGAGGDGGVSALLAVAAGSAVTREGEAAAPDDLGNAGQGGAGAPDGAQGRVGPACVELNAETWLCR